MTMLYVDTRQKHTKCYKVREITRQNKNISLLSHLIFQCSFHTWSKKTFSKGAVNYQRQVNSVNFASTYPWIIWEVLQYSWRLLVTKNIPHNKSLTIGKTVYQQFRREEKKLGRVYKLWLNSYKMTFYYWSIIHTLLSVSILNDTW